MRSSWVFCEKRGRLIPKDEYYSEKAESGVLIFPDIADFVSPVDGKVVHGRAGLREHNKRNGVTFSEDFKDEWAQKARQREQFFQGKGKGSISGRDIAQAIEKVRSGYRPQRERDE